MTAEQQLLDGIKHDNHEFYMAIYKLMVEQKRQIDVLTNTVAQMQQLMAEQMGMNSVQPPNTLSDNQNVGGKSRGMSEPLT